MAAVGTEGGEGGGTSGAAGGEGDALDQGERGGDGEERADQKGPRTKIQEAGDDEGCHEGALPLSDQTIVP